MLSLSLILFALSRGAEAVDGGGVTPRLACDTGFVPRVLLQSWLLQSCESYVCVSLHFDCVCLS